ncbi:MAG: pyrroline-5-carboxylate reductase dimerization domain-containing protein [Sphingomicrobium sp.]
MTTLASPTWLVGCGEMAGAMVAGWRSAGVDLSGAVAIRPSGRPVPGVRTVASIAEAGPSPRFVILGVKPQSLEDIAPELAQRLGPMAVVVSILAGVEAASLRARFFNVGAIVRAMPNLPVAIRRGVVGLYSSDIDAATRDQLSQLFGLLGFAAWTGDETQLAAIGSVAGAGPAYTARFVTALARAAVERGLDPALAATIALETVLGTAWLAAATGETMDMLARRVASPDGTTEAGLGVLDRDSVLDQLMAVTIAAAARRGAELAVAARPLAVETSLA